MVTWSPLDDFFFVPLAELTTVEVYPGQEVRTKGSGWVPDQKIVQAICTQDLDLATVTASEYGAFGVFVTLPPSSPLEMGPVSVKAWVLTSNGYVPEATWSLDIVTEGEFYGIMYERLFCINNPPQ